MKRIRDIKKGREIINNEMKRVRGGACPEGMVIMKGLGCVSSGHISGADRKKDMPAVHKRIITDKIYDNLNEPEILFAVSMTRKIA